MLRTQEEEYLGINFLDKYKYLRRKGISSSFVVIKISK